MSDLLDEAHEFLLCMDKTEYADALFAIRAELACKEKALAAAKTVIEAKDKAYALIDQRFAAMAAKAATTDSERECNERLTAEIDALTAELAEARRHPVEDICNAYESGVGHNGRPTANVNPYPPGTPQHTAYELGAKGTKHSAAAVPEAVAKDAEIFPGTTEALKKLSVLPSKDQP